MIEVLWRPGCPYCSRLRRDLARAGVVTVERDIWADPGAAAQVRAATGGDETVPTVVVGTRVLVNPRLGEVVAAVRGEFPTEAAGLLGRAGEPAPAPVWREGATVGVAVAVLWVLLAAWRPDTQWHLAPFLAAAAPPWLLARRGAPDRVVLPLLRRVGAVSAVGVVALSVALGAFGLLRGPTLIEPGPLGLWAPASSASASTAGASRATPTARAQGNTRPPASPLITTTALRTGTKGTNLLSSVTRNAVQPAPSATFTRLQA